MISIAFLIALTCCICATEGGSCWFAVGNNGRCQGYMKTGVSFRECCSDKTVNNGWTADDNPASSQLFYWHAIAGGAPHCHSCMDSCDDLECGPNERCKLRHGRPRCVCDPNCSQLRYRHRGPICGTDRRTYRNHCALSKRNCRHSVQVGIDFFGECQAACDDVTCDHGKFCVQDQHGLPHCIRCVTSCPGVAGLDEAVCGTDGVTYDSLCHFQRSTCISEAHGVRMAYRGQCNESLTCDVLPCPPWKKCLHDVISGRPRCVTCIHDCVDDEDSPEVCGTDGITYTSFCHMKFLSCRSGKFVETYRAGSCF